MEAMHLLTTGVSFRTQHMKEMVRDGESHFFLEMTFDKFGVEQSLRMAFDGADRKIYHNLTLCPSASGILGLLPGAVMTPDDIALIKGPPKGRRRFLDLQLAQSDPMYVHHLGRYGRAMRHRNLLLRSRSAASMEAWEHELARSGSYLVRQRYRAVEELQDLSRRSLAGLSSAKEEMRLTYTSHCSAQEPDMEGFYRMMMEKMRRRDMQFGSTSAGPHRDDIQIYLCDREARQYASEGQQRSCVAALRLAEWERLNRLADEPPYLLVDDIGISFDKARRGQMLGLVQGLHQVFVTTSDASVVEGITGHKIEL